MRARRQKSRWSAALILAAAIIAAALPGEAQSGSVTVRATIHEEAAKGTRAAAPVNSSDVVVWLKPLDTTQPVTAAQESGGPRPQIVQRNKQFEPHLLVVQVGTLVDFPNRDPFFHNVFSLFDGKRFDLGLYEGGSTNSVRFDRLGVSYLFCNIHPEMSAVVVAVDTPYFATSDASGAVTIANVPDGRYEMHVWYERGLPDELKNLTRVVRISDSTRDLGTLAVTAHPDLTSTHANKYGEPYVPPPSNGYGNQ